MENLNLKDTSFRSNQTVLWMKGFNASVGKIKIGLRPIAQPPPSLHRLTTLTDRKERTPLVLEHIPPSFTNPEQSTSTCGLTP